jgi:ubiquinone/menaquinone biosynthesis C-methylase UbiE
MVGHTGKVIAVDLQPGLLQIVRSKIAGTELEQRIVLHRCEADKTGLSEKADFVLAFYMIHEVPDQTKLFGELKSILKPGGRMLIIEPKFHVSSRAFEDMIARLNNSGFHVAERPRIFFSRSVLLTTQPIA